MVFRCPLLVSILVFCAIGGKTSKRRSKKMPWLSFCAGNASKCQKPRKPLSFSSALWATLQQRTDFLAQLRAILAIVASSAMPTFQASLLGTLNGQSVSQ